VTHLWIHGMHAYMYVGMYVCVQYYCQYNFEGQL